MQQKNYDAASDEERCQPCRSQDPHHGIDPNSLDDSEVENPDLIDEKPGQDSKETSQLGRYLVGIEQSFAHCSDRDQRVLQSTSKKR